MNWLKEMFTDARGRPEAKMIIGLPIGLAAVVYGIISKDWAGFGAMAGFAASLFVTTAVGDAAIDKLRGPNEGA